MSIMLCEQHGHWDSDFHEGCPRCAFVPLISKADLDEMLQRAEMAADVTLPIERFRDLVLQAMEAA